MKVGDSIICRYGFRTRHKEYIKPKSRYIIVDIDDKHYWITTGRRTFSVIKEVINKYTETKMQRIKRLSKGFLKAS